MVKDARDEPDDRFGRRHQDVRRLFRRPAAIKLEHDATVMENDNPVGRGRLQKTIEVERGTVRQPQRERLESDRALGQRER